MSVKLLGFAAIAETDDAPAFANVIRAELEAARALLGSTMVAISAANTKSELIFLRTCIELRVPTIVLLPTEDSCFKNPDREALNLRETLLSVSLAKYPTPQSSISILEWADALLCACGDDENEILSDALALGIPFRILDSKHLTARWTHPPEPTSPTRHGFPSRRELLEFLGKTYGI